MSAVSVMAPYFTLSFHFVMALTGKYRVSLRDKCLFAVEQFSNYSLD